MSPGEVLEALVGLCREAGLDVRRVRRGPDLAGEPPTRSGVCRVRGALWLVLSDADGVEERIATAAQALRVHAPEIVEGRWLPPAVRQRLGGDGAAS